MSLDTATSSLFPQPVPQPVLVSRHSQPADNIPKKVELKYVCQLVKLFIKSFSYLRKLLITDLSEWVSNQVKKLSIDLTFLERYLEMIKWIDPRRCSFDTKHVIGDCTLQYNELDDDDDDDDDDSSQSSQRYMIGNISPTIKSAIGSAGGALEH
ncbi:unnamed protein product [Rhizophagus irregularis]|nr:unnamed protein product [Rhizophagus irregularis]